MSVALPVEDDVTFFALNGVVEQTTMRPPGPWSGLAWAMPLLAAAASLTADGKSVSQTDMAYQAGGSPLAKEAMHPETSTRKRR